jgi:electron transfer flavoprotein alpha subunit
MSGIFIYSERLDIASELITFAREAGKPAVLLALSADAAQSAKNLGADKVYYLKGESPLAESYALAVAQLLQKQGSELFAVGATASGRDLAARTAGYLDCAMVSDVLSVSCADGQIQTERMMYGGAVLQRETLSGLSVITVPPGKFESSPPGLAEVEVVEVSSDPRVRLVETAPIVRQGTDLSKAERVVCIGLGMEKKEDMKIALELAEVLGAELGCSRGIAEERHWLPVEQYIGISGAIVKPQLYISMGISGQVQHTVGIRDARLIVAIDLNDKAPIFKAADYGIVGDMNQVVPMLTEAIKKMG